MHCGACAFSYLVQKVGALRVVGCAGAQLLARGAGKGMAQLYNEALVQVACAALHTLSHWHAHPPVAPQPHAQSVVQQHHQPYTLVRNVSFARKPQPSSTWSASMMRVAGAAGRSACMQSGE